MSPSGLLLYLYHLEQDLPVTHTQYRFAEKNYWGQKPEQHVFGGGKFAAPK